MSNGPAASAQDVAPGSALPGWARDAIQLYESNAASQFVLYGNVYDQLLIPAASGQRLGTLNDLLRQVMLPRFDVVLSYDLGNGIRVEKGGETFCKWPALQQSPELPKAPRAAVERLTQYFRYIANLGRLNRGDSQVACIVQNANLLAPMMLKKQLVEEECNGLIEFIQSTRTLDDIYGQEKVKAWLRQDITLWRNNDVQAVPKGYLLCGPVGTGKTFMVECLAGEAGVPVVKLKNFRDKWVGSTEGNLEKIFRLLQALGRCYVFIDEADQAIGRRDSGGSDSGISGRIYSMLAEEMGSSTSRGKLIWILASSRPDLIEVDLKRPGRVDVKIPLFPTTDTRESFDLLRMLCQRRQVSISEADYEAVREAMPLLLTPGAAETLAVKVYRIVRTVNKSPLDALKSALIDYQNPVPLEILQAQITPSPYAEELERVIDHAVRLLVHIPS